MVILVSNLIIIIKYILEVKLYYVSILNILVHDKLG